MCIYLKMSFAIYFSFVHGLRVYEDSLAVMSNAFLGTFISTDIPKDWECYQNSNHGNLRKENVV